MADMEVEVRLVVIGELRAGTMELREGRLQADARKGLLRLVQDEEEMTHVLWSVREGAAASGPSELDIVVFPGECVLQQIPGQPRCFTLEFPMDPSRNLFFWSQQPKAVDDESLVARANAVLAGELVGPWQGTAAATVPAHVPASAAPQPSAPQAPTPTAGAPAFNMADLLSLSLAASGMPQPGMGSQAEMRARAQALFGQMGGASGSRVQVDEGPSLQEVLQPQLLAPLLRQPGMLESLAPHLPEEHRSVDQLVNTVQSPQFQQQVATFSHALQTGQLDLSQFGLEADGFSVLDFLQAMQRLADKEKAQH